MSCDSDDVWCSARYDRCYWVSDTACIGNGDICSTSVSVSASWFRHGTIRSTCTICFRPDAVSFNSTTIGDRNVIIVQGPVHTRAGTCPQAASTRRCYGTLDNNYIPVADRCRVKRHRIWSKANSACWSYRSVPKSRNSNRNRSRADVPVADTGNSRYSLTSVVPNRTSDIVRIARRRFAEQLRPHHSSSDAIPLKFRQRYGGRAGCVQNVKRKTTSRS